MQGSFFRVDGADLETGEETYLVLQAATSQDAEEIARAQGLLIAGVREATPADWGAPVPNAPALAIPVYSPVSETIVFDAVGSGAGKVTEPAVVVTPWSELEGLPAASQPLALAEPEDAPEPAVEPVAAVRAAPTAEPFELAEPPAAAAHVGAVFSDSEVPITKSSAAATDESVIPLASEDRSSEVHAVPSALPAPEPAPTPDPYAVPEVYSVPAVIAANDDHGIAPQTVAAPAHAESPHPEKSDAVVPVALVEPEPIEAFAPVVAPAVSAPRTTPVKAVAHADGARRVTAAPTAAPPSGGSAQTARPATSAPKISGKPGVAPAKKNLNPAPRSTPGRTSAGPVSAAPAGRTADSVRPGATQQSSATRSKRAIRTAPAAAQRVTPPAMPPATQRVTPPIAPPAAKTPVSEQAHPVVEPPAIPTPLHPEPIAPIVEPSVGSGMEQMVTKLALDQTALQVEHSTGSALEHLAGLYEQPAYSSGAAHAAEYSSDSFAPTMQQATPHVATEASSAAAAADVPIAWVAAPVAPASAPATPQPTAPAPGASYITLFVAPISFLLFAGGAGLLAYGMLHNVDAGDNEMLKLDLRLQNMSYCMLGGFSLIAGLLGFVAAGMAHLAGAVRRGK